MVYPLVKRVISRGIAGLIRTQRLLADTDSTTFTALTLTRDDRLLLALRYHVLILYSVGCVLNGFELC